MLKGKRRLEDDPYKGLERKKLDYHKTNITFLSCFFIILFAFRSKR